MNPLEEKILEKISKKELEEKINEKMKSFNGFITRDIGLKLIAEDLKIINANEERIYKIKDIPKNGRGIILTANITKVMPKIVYPSGKKSRDMVLSDETGFISLKLWEKYLRLFEQLKLGDLIKVSSAYTRNGELSIGYKGKISLITPSPFVKVDELPDKEYVNLRGYIESKIGYGYYEPERKAKKYFDFILKSENGKNAKCRIEFGPTRGDKININDEIILEHAYVKNGIIRIFSTTRMRKKSSNGLIEGKVENVKTENNKNIIINITDENGNKSTINIPKKEFYEFMHISVNEDITLETIIKLSEQKMIGKVFVFKKEYLENNK